MKTHWNTLAMLLGLMAGLVLARYDDFQSDPAANMPNEDQLAEVVEGAERLLKQELTQVANLEALVVGLEQQQQQLQQQQQQQQQDVRAQQRLVDYAAASANLLQDDIPNDISPVRTLSRLIRPAPIPLPKATPYQKPRDEKRINHYMQPCHFKLCNIGRKRNTRHLHFWN